jgi:hypothetical protein
VSPWMTAFYMCAVLLAPMLFMGMLPSAHAQDTEKADTGVTGPGKSSPSVELEGRLPAGVMDDATPNADLVMTQSLESISERPTRVWVS